VAGVAWGACGVGGGKVGDGDGGACAGAVCGAGYGCGAAGEECGCVASGFADGVSVAGCGVDADFGTDEGCGAAV